MCQVPQVKGSVPQPPTPTSKPNHNSRLSPVLVTEQLQIRGSHYPLLRFDEFSRVAVFRGTYYLLDDWLIIKVYNSGTARWKRCTGQGVGKGRGASMSSPSMCTSLSQHLHLVTNPEALQTQYFGVFMEASLYRHDGLSHWPGLTDSTSSPLSPPRKSGGGTDISNSLFAVGSPGNQPSSLGVFQKSPH